LGFDPWRELRQSLDQVWPKAMIVLRGWLLVVFLGLWPLIKRIKYREKRVHDDVAQGEERREKNKSIRKR
jgi:hypothetical protein